MVQKRIIELFFNQNSITEKHQEINIATFKITQERKYKITHQKTTLKNII